MNSKTIIKKKTTLNFDRNFRSKMTIGELLSRKKVKTKKKLLHNYCIYTQSITILMITCGIEINGPTPIFLNAPIFFGLLFFLNRLILLGLQNNLCEIVTSNLNIFYVISDLDRKF